jgi:hypothetical protein
MSCQLQEDSPACSSSAFCTLDLPRTGYCYCRALTCRVLKGPIWYRAASKIGVRETRRILGDYQLTVDDILQAGKFRDVIARSTYPVDIHNPEDSGMLVKRLPPGEAYGIPLRSLLPRYAGIHGDRAGCRCVRCVSSAHEQTAASRAGVG